MTLIYSDGTVSVTVGSAVVTGSGTAWAVYGIAGGSFSCAGLNIPILSVDSDTSLTLAYMWPGTTASGATYAIQRENSNAANMVDVYDRMSIILRTLSLAGITPDNSGTLAKRNALTLTAANDNYLFLHAELGVAFAFYRWDGPSLAWIGPFPVADAAAGGPVSSLVPGVGIAIDSTNPAVPVVNVTRPGTAKATPVDADEVSLFDSAASYVLKRLTWLNVKATLKTYFDTLYTSTALVRREVLTANRTYYVRADGNDSNTGLVNSAGGAFLTVQKAVDVICKTLDLAGFTATISCGAGTFTGPGFGAPIIGGNVAFIGAGSGSTTFTSTGSAALQVSAAQNGQISIASCKLTGTGAATSGIRLDAAAKVTLGNDIEFGACTGRHMLASAPGAFILATPNYTISGGATCHYEVGASSFIRADGATLTLTGTPAFSAGFAVATFNGVIQAGSKTFVGSATGPRFNVSTGGGISTSGGGASYFPGSTAGVTTSPGWYV